MLYVIRFRMSYVDGDFIIHMGTRREEAREVFDGLQPKGYVENSCESVTLYAIPLPMTGEQTSHTTHEISWNKYQIDHKENN